MADKSGGGRFFWLILGVLIGVAGTLAVLVFLASGPRDATEGPSIADEAAAAAAPEPAPAPAPVAVAPRAAAPPLHDAGSDPVIDDQMAEDAAAAGMTSRTPPAVGQ